MFVGPDIVLVAVECEGGRVQLGIEAPRDVTINREKHVPAGDPRWDNAPKQ